MTQSEPAIELGLGAETIHCTAEEVAGALASLLREMRTAAPFVTPEERETLRLIMSHPGGTLSVSDVFPNFDRDSDALTTLRRLRTAQFIRPADRDRWEADERIEIKPFARLVWDKLGEVAIFGEMPDDHATANDIDLSLPIVNEPAEERPVPQEASKTVPAWDEADVLEFLNDDSAPTLKADLKADLKTDLKADLKADAG